jgi:hypothetical protein
MQCGEPYRRRKNAISANINITIPPRTRVSTMARAGTMTALTTFLKMSDMMTMSGGEERRGEERRGEERRGEERRGDKR